MGEPSEGVKNSMQREYTDFLRGLWNKTALKGEEKIAAQFKSDLLLLKDNKEGLNKEHILLKKKIDESKTKLIQLENNLAFFSTTSSESPMVQDVNAKIKKLNDQIEHWGNKVKQIKTLSRELKKNLETDSAEEIAEEGGEE